MPQGLANQIMGGGFSAGQVIALNGTQNTAVTAAGAAQGTATALTNSINIVTTATVNQGVKLPTVATPGDSVVIFNASGVAIIVYPPSGDKINSLATNAGFILANNTNAEIYCASSSQWLVNLSA